MFTFRCACSVGLFIFLILHAANFEPQFIHCFPALSLQIARCSSDEQAKSETPTAEQKTKNHFAL